MGRIKQMMEQRGHSTRERYNFYGAMLLPPLAVTSGIYFGLLQGNPAEDPWYVTLGKGAVALACNIPLAPIELSVGAGLFVGSSIHLRMNRTRDREKSLEQEVQEQ